jgi:hypothetical protein
MSVHKPKLKNIPSKSSRPFGSADGSEFNQRIDYLPLNDAELVVRVAGDKQAENARLLHLRFRLTAVEPTPTMFGLVATPVRDGIGFLNARHVLEVARQIGDVFDDQVNDAIRVLHSSSTAERGAAQYDAPS